MATAFYHLKLHAQYLGQTFLSNFYYRALFDVNPLDSMLTAQHLAQVFQETFLAGFYVATIRSPYHLLVPPEFVFNKITVAPVSTLLAWEYENPHTVTINIPGEADFGDMLPPENYIKVGFNLEPVSLASIANPFTKPPKSAHVKLGVLPKQFVSASGQIDSAFQGFYGLLGQNLATNLIYPPAGIAFDPVRAVRRTVKDPLTGVVVYSGYSNEVGVSSGYAVNEAFWLRSRDAQE